MSLFLIGGLRLGTYRLSSVKLFSNRTSIVISVALDDVEHRYSVALDSSSIICFKIFKFDYNCNLALRSFHYRFEFHTYTNTQLYLPSVSLIRVMWECCLFLKLRRLLLSNYIFFASMCDHLRLTALHWGHRSPGYRCRLYPPSVYTQSICSQIICIWPKVLCLRLNVGCPSV